MDIITIDHVITTGGNCTAQGPCIYNNICPTEKASGVHAVCYRKATKPGKDKGETWQDDTITNTLNGFEFHSQVRTPETVIYKKEETG